MATHHRGTDPRPRDTVPCQICGDVEPFHVHKDGVRTENYFVVGRGQTDFTAARAWKSRALRAERRLQELFDGLDK